MPLIDIKQAGGPAICAFLDMLASAQAEGTRSSPVTRCDGYDVIVSGVDGPNRFDDFSQHPFASDRKPIEVNLHGLTSTASGRYQFMLHDWIYYKLLLNLPDFGPLSQDRWCIQLLKERGAFEMLLDGKLDEAITRCSYLWASLPGNHYGQPQASLCALHTVYHNALEALTRTGDAAVTQTSQGHSS